MASFCVACGNQCPRLRCLACWRAFTRGGGVKRQTTVSGEPGGIRVANIAFVGQALSAFCRSCGHKIEPQRLRGSLLSFGTECYSCSTCSWNKRMAGVTAVKTATGKS